MPGLGGGCEAGTGLLTASVQHFSCSTLRNEARCRHSLSKYTHCSLTFSTRQLRAAELGAANAEITANRYLAGWNRETPVLSFSRNNDLISCQEAIWQVPSCGLPQKKCWLDRDPSRYVCWELSLLEVPEIAVFMQVG